MPSVGDLWLFLVPGYLATVVLETPVLIIGLSRAHRLSRRIFSGVWLTACTYPIVVLALPIVIGETYGRATYLAVAETFAPMTECALFCFAFNRDATNTRRGMIQDCVTIIAANLVSFLSFEGLRLAGLMPW